MRIRERKPYPFEFPTLHLVNEWLAQGNGEVKYRRLTLPNIYASSITCTPIPYFDSQDNTDFAKDFAASYRYWGETDWKPLDLKAMCDDLGYPDAKMWALHEKINAAANEENATEPEKPKEYVYSDSTQCVTDLPDITAGMMLSKLKKSIEEAMERASIETDDPDAVADMLTRQLSYQLEGSGIEDVVVTAVRKVSDCTYRLTVSTENDESAAKLEQFAIDNKLDYSRG